MDITYFGHSSFKINGKQVSVIVDPFDPKMVGLKYPKQKTDIVTISHDHGDHNYLDGVEADRVIEGPGEYEIKGVSFIGIQSFHDDKNGDDRGKNTIFVIEIDKFRLVHLGDLGHTLTEEQNNQIGDVDIAFIPVGGKYTIGPQKAVEVARSIEPNIVIPMHYKMSGMNMDVFGELETYEPFVSGMGLKADKAPKFSMKSAELMGEDQQIIVLDKK